jgi:beta-phosphoglucomutase-like phosphatase (HAD superfamily)
MKAADAAKEAALAENVLAKEDLVIQAEALLPPGDLTKGKSALRSIQRRWDALGGLPKADRTQLEARLKRVEDAFRDAERERWKDSTSHAVPGAQAFTAALDRLEEQLAAARKSGNDSRVTELEASIASTRALLQAAGTGSR